MTVENRPERAPDPSFVIDDGATAEQRQALAEFESVAQQTAPEYISEGIEIYDDNPRMTLAVAKIVTYLRRNPDGLKLFEAWSKVLDTQADKVSWFDERTEEYLESDEEHAALVHRARNGGGQEAVSVVRRSRFASIARRIFEASDGGPQATSAA